jgi:gluconolactonase
MELQGKVIASGLKFPEGPIALADGTVLFVEIAGATLKRWRPSGEVEVLAHLGGGPNGAAMGPDGRCYVCNNGGFSWRTDDGFTRPTGAASHYSGGCIQAVDLNTGKVIRLYTQCGEIQLRGPNDIVFDRNGGFWFTDFGKTIGRTLDRGAVFYARIDGSFIKQVIFPIMTPNGVGLSPDGKRLYVSETETSRLWAYDIIGEGEVSTKAWPSPNGGQLVHGLPGFQRFDSLALEANGNICVATLVSGGITVFAPSGEMLEFHQASEGYCTNIAFGGPDHRTAFITLSGYGDLFAAQWPRPGLPLHF